MLCFISCEVCLGCVEAFVQTVSSLLVVLQFFMLILFIFLAELAAAILAFLFREHVSLDSPNCVYHYHLVRRWRPDPRCFLCLVPVNQRVFQPGAQASLPRSQQHRRLYIHLERHHDHGEPLILQSPLHQRPSPSCCSSSRRVSVYSSTAVASAAPRTSRRVSSGSSAPVRWSLRPVARGTVTLELAAWSSVWAAAWPSDTTRSLQETRSSH